MKERIKALAAAAEKHPDFNVRRFDDSIHIMWDGFDVASLDGEDVGCNSKKLEDAEKLFGLDKFGENEIRWRNEWNTYND